MRIVAPLLDTELQKPNPRLAFCWLLEPQDAPIEGYTSWDRDLIVDGQLYQSRAGVLPSAYQSSLGVGEADAADVSTLSDAGLVADGALCVSTQRLLTGYYEGAAATIFVVAPRTVNPATPLAQAGALLLGGLLGTATRGERKVTFSLQPWSHLLSRSVGYRVKPACQCARFGRGRCRNAVADGGAGDGIDIAARTIAGTVVQVLGRTQIVVQLDQARPDDWATAGIIRWMDTTSSLYQPDRDDTGLPIKTFAASGLITMRLRLVFTPTVGERVVVEAGCERTLAACQAKGNVVNLWMAFPHLPGQDGVVKRQISSG